MSCFQFIEEFVKKDPNSIALKQGDKFLTYQALNAKANQFARVISEQSEGKNNIIAVCLDRSFELFVTLLAILKSGNAFLVVDPNGSKHRNEKILCDADPKFIITSEIDSEHLSISHIEKMSNLKSIENLDVEINPFDLAYVVYTSGTTGQPKGVLIEHESLEKLILEKGKILELNAKTCTLQVMSLGFDGFIWEWLSVLSHGGCLKILEIKNSDLISELGKPHHDVTYITAPASLASLLSKDNFMNLQTLLLAGESCSKKLIESWSEVAKVFNCYGPSEATIGCTIFKCDPSYPANTIGKSFQHCEVLVLNAELQLAEINQTGEIYISGDCLARGYLNDSILTAQKFIKISHFNNKTFYQTGDLARYLDDHNIEFIGRADNQVKIRGYRVELSEIESCILSLNYVAQAHCQTYTSEVDTKILASVVLDHSDDSAEHENVKQMINDHLKSELPNYMLPSDIDVCVKFPITNNGKINRQLF